MPLFQSSHKSCNDAVIKNFRLEVIDPNRILVEEGKIPTHYYIILSGHIDVFKKSQQHQQELRMIELNKNTKHGLWFETRIYDYTQPRF